MSTTRRNFFQNATVISAALFGLPSRLSAEKTAAAGKNPETPRPRVPVVTPDVSDLTFTLDGATKVFHLRAEPVKRKIAPFKTIDTWGYNGSCPGPTIQVNQGDRVRIHVENALPESTSMHWHGLEVPIEQDGVPFISQKPIAPGETYTYEFTVHQEGTFFYHAHSAMQEMIGLLGLFIAHPQTQYSPHCDHDFGIVLQEWAILPNNTVPNTASMEFNWLTFNGRSAPATTPLVVRLGSRVRLRFVNLGMDHHPIHLHGHQFFITGTEGGRAPESTWYPSNTVLVGVAQAKVVEFEAKYPGDWMIHCHLPHHMMNSMMDLLAGRQIQTADTTDARAMSQMAALSRDIGVPHVMHSPVAENANSVPGFPQDAFMEMSMDNAEGVNKPETHGLPANWSAGMMGMMTMLRVLPDAQFNEIQSLIRQRNVAPKAEDHTHGR
jgi:FtsP/CotA-like multicopper oxidase with cupredoxin domain